MPYFTDSKYVDVLVGVSETYLGAARRASACASAVQRASHRGYLALVVAVICGLLGAGSYAIMEKRGDHAESATATIAPTATGANQREYTQPERPAAPHRPR